MISKSYQSLYTIQFIKFGGTDFFTNSESFNKGENYSVSGKLGSNLRPALQSVSPKTHAKP